ncbi:MAG: hypothetical protein JWO14_3153 [Solirubrobacterales bacterium]|nr:hypothetical protein [Solirubrobacterales bacterium]
MPSALMVVGSNPADDLAVGGRDLQAALDSGAIPISDTFNLGAFSVDFYELMPGSERSA